MTVAETFGPALEALRAEEVRLATAIRELEQQVEKAAELDLSTASEEASAVVDALFQTTMRLLDLTNVGGVDVRGKATVVLAVVENEKLKVTHQRTQEATERGAVVDRLARQAEVAAAQAESAQEAQLLAEGDAEAHRRWKARQVPAQAAA